MDLTTFLKEYLTAIGDLDSFNKSEITRMYFLAEFKKSFCNILYDKFYLPYDVYNIEIAIALKKIITVPFTISVKRECNKISRIKISRVFLPETA